MSATIDWAMLACSLVRATLAMTNISDVVAATTLRMSTATGSGEPKLTSKNRPPTVSSTEVATTPRMKLTRRLGPHDQAGGHRHGAQPRQGALLPLGHQPQHAEADREEQEEPGLTGDQGRRGAQLLGRRLPLDQLHRRPGLQGGLRDRGQVGRRHPGLGSRCRGHRAGRELVEHAVDQRDHHLGLEPGAVPLDDLDGHRLSLHDGGGEPVGHHQTDARVTVVDDSPDLVCGHLLRR